MPFHRCESQVTLQVRGLHCDPGCLALAKHFWSEWRHSFVPSSSLPPLMVLARTDDLHMTSLDCVVNGNPRSLRAGD